MNILYLTNLFPFDLNSGNKIKTFYTISALAKEHTITLLCYTKGNENPEHIKNIEKKLGIKIQTIKIPRNYGRNTLPSLASLFSHKSLLSVLDNNNEMKEKINYLIKSFEPQIIHIDTFEMSGYINLHSKKYSIIYDCRGLYNLRFKRDHQGKDFITKAIIKKEAERITSSESQLILNSKLTLVNNENERSIINSMLQPIYPIRILPPCIDLKNITSKKLNPNSNKILFLGDVNYKHKRDALEYYLDKVIPELERINTNYHLIIAGQGTKEFEIKYKSNKIDFKGYISNEELSRISQDVRAVAVPTLTTSNNNTTILALSAGIPVVTTKHATKGLDLEDGIHLLIANNEKEFANKISTLLNDVLLAQSIADNARRYIENEFCSKKLQELLLTYYKDTEKKCLI